MNDEELAARFEELSRVAVRVLDRGGRLRHVGNLCGEGGIAFTCGHPQDRSALQYRAHRDGDRIVVTDRSGSGREMHLTVPVEVWRIANLPPELTDEFVSVLLRVWAETADERVKSN